MSRYYRFCVQLEEIEPPIWREFLIASESSFYDLHLAIQACGWLGGHLWDFRSDDRTVIAALPDPFSDRSDPDPKTVQLDSYFGPNRQSCQYVYDYGDDWGHLVTVLGIEDHEGDFKRKLIAGARNFPPENCGGLPGYERIAEFFSKGKDPWGETESLKEFLGIWTPEDFDLSEEAPEFENAGYDRLISEMEDEMR